LKLTDLAKVVRSKNAGPLQITIDLMFENELGFELARQSESLAPNKIASLYGVPVDTVAVIPFQAALAIKIAIDRPLIAGSPGDRDVFGAQQHTRLLGVEI
jgi:Domain of unknown function (DUF4387)